MKKELNIWRLATTTNKNEELQKHQDHYFVLRGSVGRPLRMDEVEFPSKSVFQWETTDIVSIYVDANRVTVKTTNSTYIFKRELKISRSMVEGLSGHCSRDEIVRDTFGRTICREVDYIYSNSVATLRYFAGIDEYGVPCIAECPAVAWVSIDGKKKYSIDDIDTLELFKLFSYLHNGEDIEKHLDEFICVYVYS